MSSVAGKSNKAEMDVIIEMMEIYINAILYKRKLYPEAIFRLRKAYNIPVYISIFKTLNEYIAQSLRAARELMSNSRMPRLEVIIYTDPEKPKESYVFDMDYQNFAKESDENMTAFEEELRKSLLSLDARMKDLKTLSKDEDVRFKIVLHTTVSAFVRIGNNPRLQNFPFVKQGMAVEAEEKSKIQLLPVMQTSRMGINVFVEEYAG